MKTTECRNCHQYVALTPTSKAHVFRAMNLATDGHTPTSQPHVCGESDRRAY